MIQIYVINYLQRARLDEFDGTYSRSGLTQSPAYMDQVLHFYLVQMFFLYLLQM